MWPSSWRLVKNEGNLRRIGNEDSLASQCGSSPLRTLIVVEYSNAVLGSLFLENLPVIQPRLREAVTPEPARGGSVCAILVV